jgi:lipopolysaccharide transport system ATP-binding protein
VQRALAPVRWLGRGRRRRSEADRTIWALKDVSLEIQHGEVVGLIGRNGAGKSTILKILSRITEPTQGRVQLQGRVGSLLEVGTGFHPELTGRENIYLNGAILGMKRVEIARKFDEIVAFAETEAFLDTPVKRYSSGMYMRLAFAVAAHLETEILLVDEVLAVGDAAFQKKCLGKIGTVAHQGRTVVLVSHNMHAILALCTRAFLLEGGRLEAAGSTRQCVEAYLRCSSAFSGACWQRPPDAPERALAIRQVTVTLVGEQPRQRLNVEILLDSHQPHKPAFLALDLLSPVGVPIMQALPTIEPFLLTEHRSHQVRLDVELPPLVPGNYSTMVWVGSHNTETLDEVSGCVGFEVQTSPTPNRTYPHHPDHGYIVPGCTLGYTHS